ncbi:substrate-binding periplasmic protein [Saccharospirillum salsuginis]|uniref:Solute-binding protein family 3/N-terminal domain-containing protein n=1 Tax=Saccharospirillum salsuginis TaxID=418750 RepID=A0A918KI70_9GAMM|nr:hypothetical protein [Saccharospirillum salsuginis]GGX64260.1 hypothetical protein GCM10007392_34960 [Saccharospirillum salsuginis]
MSNLKALVWLVCLTMISAVSQADALIVRYPKPETEFDRRTDYPLRLLQLAFDKTGAEVSLVPSLQAMPQGRALVQLKNGIDVDVVWSMTSRKREADLQPIRIPIYKGLIGWRIFLAHERGLQRFSEPHSLDELRDYILVQGHDWPDTDILRSNGFQVFGTPSYDTIFTMVAQHRADLFPRSIVEIWAEAKTHENSGIVVEPTKLLTYPTAFYYFVNPEDTELALLIERGLKTALADGSFDALFHEYHADLIEKARLEERERYRLNNPLLPELTPLGSEALWFSLSAE